MFKKIVQFTLMSTLALSMMAFAPVPVEENSTGSVLPAVSLQTVDLSDEVIDGLLYLREEEKLAHDVYVYLYDLWGMNIFENIADSEQTHTDAVKILLDTYGLQDPADGIAVGEFTNPELQALYDQLIAQGSLSLSDALKVGATIEELDILDLREAFSQTTALDIQQVYENLENGSGNHLESFASTLFTQTGEEYQPQYLSLEDYQTIISSRPGNAGNGQGNGNGNGTGTGIGMGNGMGSGTGTGSRPLDGTGNANGNRGGRQ